MLKLIIKKTVFITFMVMLYSANLSLLGSQQQTPGSGTKKDKPSIVREGTIDLKKIDKNKDGKVFQDQMDWNVISDEKGSCPLCKMTLEEVTIEKAKKNLIIHGFKTKK